VNVCEHPTQHAHVSQPFTSLPQKVFSAIWEVESEVNNGGFSQYFLNSSAESASFVVKALETVGAPKTADICKRAIDPAFPAGLPQSLEAIRSTAAFFPDEVLAALEPLDQEFFSYPHDLTELVFVYVSQHPEEFGPMPKPDDACELVRGYRDVLEDDPEAVEQTARILRLIQKSPGASQRGICKFVKEEYGVSRGRALEILRRETGVLWWTTGGAFNSKLYRSPAKYELISNSHFLRRLVWDSVRFGQSDRF
jgi:hypothetical protein